MFVVDRFRASLALLGLALPSSLAVAAHFAGNDIVEKTAGEVATEIKARRPEFDAQIRAGRPESDAQTRARRPEFDAKQHELYKVVHSLLLPHFDMQEGSRAILAEAWNKYTDAERDRFVNAFYTYLLATFGDRIIYVKANTVRVKPFEGEPPNPAHVRTIVTMNDGTEVDVDFVMKRESDGDWRVSDIVAEGASYDRMYRSQFRVDIATDGLESVIQWLRRKAETCYMCHQEGLSAAPNRDAPPP